MWTPATSSELLVAQEFVMAAVELNRTPAPAPARTRTAMADSINIIVFCGRFCVMQKDLNLLGLCLSDEG